MAKMREWGAWVGCGLGRTKPYESKHQTILYCTSDWEILWRFSTGRLKITDKEGRDAQLVKCMHCRHEDPSLIPKPM